MNGWVDGLCDAKCIQSKKGNERQQKRDVVEASTFYFYRRHQSSVVVSPFEIRDVRKKLKSIFGEKNRILHKKSHNYCNLQHERCIGK